MWENVAHDWQGDADRQRFCQFINMVVNGSRPHPTGVAITFYWHPLRLEDPGMRKDMTHSLNFRPSGEIRH